MSLCNNHENNETNISFYSILLNACAKGTCSEIKFNMAEYSHFCECQEITKKNALIGINPHCAKIFVNINGIITYQASTFLSVSLKWQYIAAFLIFHKFQSTK